MKHSIEKILYTTTLILVPLLLFLIGCRKNQASGDESLSRFSPAEKQMIKSFLASPEYNRIYKEGMKDRFGEPDLNYSAITYVDNDPNKPVLNLAFSKNSRINSVLQVIPLPVKYNNVLPGDEHYLMINIDYSSYEKENNTGVIKLNDLNYDGYTAVEASLTNGKFQRVYSNQMPENLVKKYANLKKKRDLGSPVYQGPGVANYVVLCDEDGNGNLSFGECYSCLKKACEGDSECALLCFLVNLASGLPGIKVPAACNLSIGAACIYLSIVY